VMKSGGPPMTIDYLPGERVPAHGQREAEYFCRWFAGATEKNGWFGEHLLEAYTPPVKK